jgi:hypothetical protein
VGSSCRGPVQVLHAMYGQATSGVALWFVMDLAGQLLLCSSKLGVDSRAGPQTNLRNRSVIPYSSKERIEGRLDCFQRWLDLAA